MAHSERRKKLIELIKKAYPGKNGIIIFCAALEAERVKFHQDSSFFYFTGLHEPGIVVTQELMSQDCVLFEPAYTIRRSLWAVPGYTDQDLQKLGVREQQVLGEKIPGYTIDLFTLYNKFDAYKNLVMRLEKKISEGYYIFVAPTDVSPECAVIIERIMREISGAQGAFKNIAPLIAQLRRSKDQKELELMYRAIEISAIAQETAAQAIEPAKKESDIQALIDYVYTESQAVDAFPTIVGSGKNSTVLHYTQNSGVLESGDLVVIDSGACYKQYCADLTRTYPVSGKFTDRQREIYEIVLETQAYIAGLVKPGIWINNPEFPEQSLNHRAHDFIKARGYGDYFPHGIGHFIGLDTHDVGDSKIALAVGDVITIEPGIYISEECLGVRIEDMYWIVQDGVICLSDGLPKTIDEVEKLMCEK